jgi:hypothetical protein
LHCNPGKARINAGIKLLFTGDAEMLAAAFGVSARPHGVHKIPQKAPRIAANAKRAKQLLNITSVHLLGENCNGRFFGLIA